MILSVPIHLFEHEMYHQTYTLHSTYQHTQNYCHGKELVALHDKSRIPSPMGIILLYDAWAFERLKAVLRTVRVEEHAITINDVRVLKTDVRLSRHDLKQTICSHRPLGEGERKVLQGAIEDEIRCAGLRQLPELERRADLLGTALARKQGVADAIKALIGFGEGLTPSGDDIVCGLLAGLLYTGAMELFEIAGATVLSIIDDEKVTSQVSRSFLKFGGKGLFIETLVTLYERLSAHESIGELVQIIGGLGHRSGTDYLMGIQLGLQLGGSDR